MSSEKIQSQRRAVYSLHAHLVFATKRRGKVLTDTYLVSLEKIFKDICEEFETELVEFNGESDHVHLLVFYPPKIALSQLVNRLKGVSSFKLKKLHPEISKFWSIAKSDNSLWSPSYFCGSVGGAPISVLREYIENQKRPLHP
jgi:putative transposase